MIHVPVGVQLEALFRLTLATLVGAIIGYERETKGHAAAAALTAEIERARTGAKGKARHLSLPTELVVRGSTVTAGSVY